MFIQAHQEIVKKLVELIGITSIMEVGFWQHLFFALLYCIILPIFIVNNVYWNYYFTILKNCLLPLLAEILLLFVFSFHVSVCVSVVQHNPILLIPRVPPQIRLIESQG